MRIGGLRLVVAHSEQRLQNLRASLVALDGMPTFN